ncbi:hypothetical protein Gpo141_00014538 [Globisporangium polare]
MKFLVATAALAALAPQLTDAHGFISEPKATYTGGSSYTSFSAEITASVNKGFSGHIFNRSPEQNVAEFTAAWPKTGYTSLKQMMDAAVPGCGYTNPNAAPVDVSSLSVMKYQNNEYKQGFLDSHHGPCEGWIDGTKVFHSDDCVKSYPGYPASIPVSYSSCKGTCRLTFYWLAVHSQKWQAYKGCVAIKNGSGGGSSTTAGEADTTKTTGTTNNNNNNNSNKAATPAPKTNSNNNGNKATPSPNVRKAGTPNSYSF